jgi:hypothetical protein
MRTLDLGTSQDTLVAVIIGAALATLGGVLAGQVEHYLIRRERERNAGLLFGEILAALNMILQLADEARGRGDPFGPITMRILKAAQRETQIYDRNREFLFAVRDAALRARTHILLLQMSLTLDAVFEASAAIGEGDTDGLAALEGSFDFLQELRLEIPALLPKYRRIAKYSFEAHDRSANPDINPLAQRGPQAAAEQASPDTRPA